MVMQVVVQPKEYPFCFLTPHAEISVFERAYNRLNGGRGGTVDRRPIHAVSCYFLSNMGTCVCLFVFRLDYRYDIRFFFNRSFRYDVQQDAGYVACEVGRRMA